MLLIQDLIFILVPILVVFVFWNIYLTFQLQKAKKKITFFFKGKKAEDLEILIFEILKKERLNEKEIWQIKQELKSLDKVALRSLQKVGIVRFNPFNNMGGNQSFSIAILDQKDDGIVISSYHSREGTRVYAKPLKNGESEYPLSKEEEEAIKKAIKS